MSLFEPRDPYSVLTQQQFGIEECQAFAYSPWKYLERESDVIRTIWNLGAWLQPAVEGLVRQYPEYAELTSFGPGRSVIHGIQAYETWMRAGREFKHEHVLSFTPPVRGNDRLVHELGIGKFFMDNVTIVTEVRLLPLSPSSLRLPGGIITLKNTYGDAISSSVRDEVRQEFAEELCDAYPQDVLIYSPFERMNRTERALLGPVVKQRFGEEAVQIYESYGKQGLIQYRLWSSLRSVLDNLPGFTATGGR